MTPLWLRSVHGRPQTMVLLVLLSTVAVMTAMLGPLLVRAVDQSTLTDALDVGGLDGSSLSISSEAGAGEPQEGARVPIDDAMAGLSTGPAAPLWQPPVTLVRSTTIVIWSPRGGLGTDAQVNGVDEGCDGYVITAGSCPAVKSQVMISSVDAQRQRVRVGDRISFSLARSDDVGVTVVGLYDAAASTASAGLIRPGTTAGVLAGIKGDALVMSTAQLADLPLPVLVTVRSTLRPGLTLGELPALQASIDATKAAVNRQDRLLALRSDLPDIITRVTAQAAAAQVLILVTGVQALFLAVYALAIVLQRVGRARAAEWGVGRLRGVPRRRWLASVYTEPLVALLVGLPLGFAAGIGAARLGVGWALRPGTPVEPWHLPVVASALAATLIAVAALVVVSLRSLRQPLAELVQQQAEARRLGVVGAVVHAGVVLLAAASVYQLLSGGLLGAQGGQLGLLAPGLLALAVAMLAVRLAVLVVARITTRPPSSLASLVVGRHAARSPSTLNPAMIIAVGVALTVFATQVLALSVRNQELRADAATGADTVLTVSVPRDGDLLTAVRGADPSGRFAMAVQESAVGEFSGAARLIAVDSTRLEAVSAWSPAWSGVADVAAALRGPVSTAVELRGSRIEVDLTGVRAEALAVPDPTAPNAVDPSPPPELVVTVTTGGSWRTVSLGQLERAAGSTGKSPVDQRLTADLPCPQGCRLVAIGLRARTNQPYRATFTVAAIGTDQQPAADSHAWLRTADRWREQSVNQTVGEQLTSAVPEPGSAGLIISAVDRRGSGLTSVSPTDTADPLPAVLAPGTTVEPVPGREGAGYGTGLDGQQQKLQVVGRAAILPRALDTGVLVDLGNAQGLSDPATSQTIDEVWLAPDAPASIEQRLVDAGLSVERRESLATERTALENQATTRGAAVAVTISAAALLLSLLALVAARWADAAHRGADWRALREAGVRPSRLRRLVALEIAVPAAAAVLVGLLSGAVAAVIAAPRLPLVDLSAAGPPLDLRLAWEPIAVIGVGTVVLLVVIALVGALAEIRPRRWR
jgi:putative ABC transport system permease protein